MIIDKLKQLRYVKSPLIFGTDLFLSLLATLFTYGFITNIVGQARNLDKALELGTASLIVTGVLLLCFRLSRDIIRYSTLYSIFKIALIAIIKSLVLAVYISVSWSGFNYILYSGLIDFFSTTCLLVSARLSLIIAYRLLINKSKGAGRNALFYGTTGLNPSLVQQINNDIHSQYRIVGFLSTNPDIIGHCIGGEVIYKAKQSQDKLNKLFQGKQIRSVIFSSYERFQSEDEGLVEYCMEKNINMLVVGKILNTGEVEEGQRARMKEIQIEDILNRKEIVVDHDKIKQELSEDCILVTGAAGSIGSEIAKQLATLGVKQLICLDTAETPMHELRMEFERCFPDNTSIIYKVGDVRSKNRVEGLLQSYKPSVIFHAAAYKHVPLMESNPCESILTNVWGTCNLAQRAKDHGVRKFIMISTDKAVNPTNIMGATKRLAEMYIQSLNKEGKTEFVTTRFGNVLGSNGSVIPHFKKQIKLGGPVTVTHPDIIRYFMTIPEACRLVLQAATMGHAGQILVFDMGEPEKITHLAEKMIKLSGFEPHKDIKIVYTGLRPGEKLYEELLATKEETLPSAHEKIRLANCRKVDHQAVAEGIAQLIALAKMRETDSAVLQLKTLVPEFKSNNNDAFEKLDKQLSTTAPTLQA